MGEDEPKTVRSIPTREDTIINGIDDVIKVVSEIEEILNILQEPEKEVVNPVSNKIEVEINMLSYVKRKLRKIVNVVSKI